MYDYTEENLSIMNSCWTCMQAERICEACAEERETRDITIAWEIVEDGNEVYRWKTTKISEQPSGHEWVGSETRIDELRIRSEFKESASLLSDRFFELDVEVPVGSTVCADCHYVCNSHIPCPNCELVNY